MNTGPIQTPSNSTIMLGAVPFTPAVALQAAEVARKTAEASAASAAMVVEGLANYIETCWSAAKQAKQPVEDQMMVNLRQRNGVYEIDKQQAISAMGGSDIYVLLTATKCRAAEAWLGDLIRPVSDRPWQIRPTPIAELPPDVMEQVKADVEAVANEVVTAAIKCAPYLNPATLKEELREYAFKQRGKALKEVQEEARVRADRMTTYMDDQLQEGGWHRAFWAVISDLVTLKAGILKGPVLKNKKVQRYSKGADGRWAPVVETVITPTFVRVSPFDLYPAPDSRNPNDGYLIERHQLSRSEIQALIGIPGYNEAKIRMVLDDYGHGLRNTLAIDSQRAPIEFSGNFTQMTNGEKIEAIEFWGSVQGRLLVGWGLKDGIDPALDYEVNVWKIGRHVIRAILNPDKLGRKPYSIDSYERIPGSFWGRGLPELMADNQDMCNSVARAISNNAQIASGPLVEVNVDRCEEEDIEIHPWKIFESTSSQMNEAPAVRFYTPPIIVEPLVKVFEFFSALSEDSTGIPRWAYGNASGGGPTDTSSGLSMLMTQASRGIKEVVGHLDQITETCIERLYDYNMIYGPDEDTKGDAKIIARASSALLAKEQRIARTNELLRSTNNPTDNQILGLEGRAKLLKEAVRGLEIDVDDIVPDKDGLKELIERVQQQQAALIARGQNPGQPGGTQPQANPANLDPSGAPMGGTASNLFMNQPGSSPNGLGGEQ